MSSVVSASQVGTYTSSHESSTISGSTDRDDFSPTQENYEVLVRRNEIQTRENSLFIEYAKRKNKDLFPQGQVSDNATRIGRHLKRRGKLPQFPTNRKLEMANHVIAQIESDIRQEERHSAAEIDEIRARQLQIGIREREIEKELLGFTREITEGARYERSEQIIGDKLLKWYDDLMKDKNAKIGKLKLKRDSMKSQIARTRARLQQKLELGEKLQQVDYDQLQINNEGFQKEIEELSQKLAALQKMSSSVVSKLNTARSRLANEERQVKEISRAMGEKRRAIDRYAKETEQVQEDHLLLLANNEDITTKRSEYRVPEVADYIEKKSKIYEMSIVIRNWERKVQLAEMNVRRLRKELEAITTPRRSD
jgi:chromosome segregation ATPase